ncbi:iron uptake porin [Calothrix sp. CCY 0018]|uniref:iron uptake porin n=1 Tax=Calothrix sp. CCY 0018 TaxID=3103864 RepID=UPI0039C5E364
MELSVKQSFKQIICSPKLLAALVGYGIFSQLCLPSEAAFTGKGDKETRGQGDKENINLIATPSTLSPPSLLSQSTSVDELSDVKPTDWAYQALKSLIEKYDLKLGLPDGTFRGNRAVTRYEFAALLAATLDKVEDAIAGSVGNANILQDRITLQRLQKEYSQALQDLRTRVNDIESRSSELQANQFSTTTKLKGQQIVGLTDGRNANFTVVSRTRLTFETSFSQKDLLITQLESGNNGGDAVGLAQKEDANLLGSDGIFANAGGLDFTDVEDDVKLRRLHYTLRPSSDFAVTVGAKMSPRDFIDGNRYANNEATDFSSGIFLNNPLIVQNRIDRNGGAGAAVVWKPKNSKLAFRSLYIAGDADSNLDDKGFFGDPHQASAELEYTFSDKLTLKLQYTNAEIDDTDINAYGVNAEYALNRNTGIFGRLGIGDYQGFNTAVNQNLDLKPVSWTLGVGLRNIGIPGTIAGVAIGQPFVTDGVGNATQTNFETFYNLRLSDNLSFTPVISLVINPDNDSDRGTIWQTTLRSTFSF